MNCYDCTTQDHLTRAAVGVCADCGAAVCEQHAVVREHHLTRIVTMMREVPVDPPARTLRCTTCDAAYAAADSDDPRGDPPGDPTRRCTGRATEPIRRPPTDDAAAQRGRRDRSRSPPVRPRRHP